MGRILCSKHGESGIAFVCSHVRRAVISNEAISEIQYWHFEFTGGIGIELYFCPNCTNELQMHDLPRSGEKSSSEQEDDRVEAIIAKVWDGSDVVCSSCLYDAAGVPIQTASISDVEQGNELYGARK